MEQKQPVVRSVQRAIDILRAFGVTENALTLTEISQKTGLAKSTATRILATLEENNFLEKDVATGKYYLGAQLYFLGHAAGRSIDLKDVAKAPMLQLREEFKETVNLYILEEEHRVCVQQFESLQSVKHIIQIGQQLPLTVGASGKVILAYQDQNFINEMMDKQQMIKSKAKLQRELNQIYTDGYADSIEERESGTSAVAAPVFGIANHLIGVVSVSGPAQRFYPREINNLQTKLKEVTMEISINMGYQP